MESRLFPASIINNTVETYDSRITVRSNIVYLVLLGILMAFFVALPLIHVDVAVQSRGTFQSALQRNSIMTSVGGRLEIWNISENQKVKKGEVLAIVRGEQITSKSGVYTRDFLFWNSLSWILTGF